MKKPLEAKARKMGTSFGVTIPKEVLKDMKVKEGDTVAIKGIEPARRAEDVEGTFPGLAFVREHGADGVA